MARGKMAIFWCRTFVIMLFVIIVVRKLFCVIDQHVNMKTNLCISNMHRQKRIGLFHDETLNLRLFNSTCSSAADARGPKQRVVAFSLYGNFSRQDIYNKYILPLKEIIDLVAKIYPGWVVRLYHNMTEDEFQYLNFVTQSHVDFCNATKIIQNRKLGDLFAMTWRWLPLLDEMVDLLMSRDTDSRIISREEEAVGEWLKSEKIFHVMRDHPAHCTIGPILGGCWGVKISFIRSRIVRVAERMFTINHSHEYDYDQMLLGNFIWPIAKTNMMAHDSFCCQIFQPSKPFPTQRRNGLFVGARALANNRTELLREQDKCPEQCRLRNTRFLSEWDFC